MSKLLRAAVLLGCILLLATTSATGFAGAKQALAANLTRKVIVVEGKETFSPAPEAKPAEVIEDTASYRNQSSKALGNVQPVLPILTETKAR